MRKHAILSASGAHRWMECTPSARLESLEPDRSSSFADEGTLAHAFAEIQLLRETSQLKVKDFLKKEAELKIHELYSDEMPDHVDAYVTYVLSQFEDKGGVLLVEEKIDLTDYIEEGFGTNDAVIISDGEMEVIDLKYGKGIRVNAENNPQLMLYGLGALRAYDLAYDIRDVRVTVVQPRLDHVSSWVISADSLREWGESFVKPKAQLAYAGDGHLVTGDHCRFCKVKHKCRALYAEATKMAEQDFKEPDLLSDAEILDAFRMAPMVKDWISSVENYVMDTAQQGKKWEGYKLVEGRSLRVWTDPEAMANRLLVKGFSADDVFDTKVKGITAIEKLVGKKDFDSTVGEFVTKPPGKPTLAPESDKRPALGLESAQNDFSN